ncbi:MAG: T9SS type A sorting domain-containing protein [Bacteroidales bacterium]|jgi:hypothetical protein|nr:T9SS type A sorting domain-containing protein [Bacteroidales bacterium]
MKHLYLILFMLLSFAGFSQNFDRIAISSGGISSDTLNATIGEVFVFSISSGGISLDAGSQSDTSNTSGITASEIFAAKESSAFVFPNPVSDFLNLMIDGVADETIAFSIFDAAGRLVLQHNSVPANNLYTLRVQSLSAGNYFLSGITSSGKTFSNIQFVKQ